MGICQLFHFQVREHPSTYRLPPLHATTFLGDTMNSMERRSSEHGGNEWAWATSDRWRVSKNQKLFWWRASDGKRENMGGSNCYRKKQVPKIFWLEILRLKDLLVGNIHFESLWLEYLEINKSSGHRKSWENHKKIIGNYKTIIVVLDFLGKCWLIMNQSFV